MVVGVSSLQEILNLVAVSLLANYSQGTAEVLDLAWFIVPLQHGSV